MSAELDALLAVQGHDTALAQLAHRQQHLPEREKLAQVTAATARLTDEASVSRRALAALVERLEVLERDVAAVDAKIGEAEKKLYGGTVTASRELQALEADIASLKRHKTSLEDVELEVMVEREPLDEAVAAADAQLRELAAEAESLRAAIEIATAEIAAEARTQAEARAEAVSHVEAELLATYDEVRARNNGIGIARLEHGTCQACRLGLAAVELDRIRQLPSRTIVRCEECGAILVR